MKRNNKGISLIVLSITILVMAILAATAIIALEDTGIIGRSKNTASKQSYNEEYTKLQVIKNGILTDNLGEITVDEYIAELTNKGLIEPGITTNSDGSKTVTTKSGFVVNIMQEGVSDLSVSLGEPDASITLSASTLSGDVTDGEITTTLTVITTNVSGDITWTTSNANVASVTGNNSAATITMKSIGEATITATYGAAKANCVVTVTATVPTPTISLNQTTIAKTIDSGTTATATLSATTANTTGTLTWSSSNTSVATVSGNGNTAVVTMKTGGNAIITASCDGVSATCSVVVTENVVDLITFTFHGTEYKAKSGMTWADWIGSAYDTTEKSWTLDEYIAETGYSPGGLYTEDELRDQGIVSLTYGRAWIASDGRVSMTGYLYYDENGELVMFEQYTDGTYAGAWCLVISGQGSSTVQYQDDTIVSGTEYSMYYD